MSHLKGFRPTPSLVISMIALFVALGGTGYAAIAITGKNVKNSSLTGKDVKDRSLSGKDVKDRSLKAADFGKGQLPAGATGAQGPQGPQGPAGSNATVNGVAAGGDLEGTYPNPTLKAGSVGSGDIADGALTAADIARGARDGAIDFPSVAAANCASAGMPNRGNPAPDIILITPTNSLPAGLTATSVVGLSTPNYMVIKVCNTTRRVDQPA